MYSSGHLCLWLRISACTRILISYVLLLQLLTVLTPSLFLETRLLLQYIIEASFHLKDCSWSPFLAPLPVFILQEET